MALAKAGEKRAKMCDDLKATMESLKAKKVKCGSVTEERWGSLTTIYLLPEAARSGSVSLSTRRPSGAGQCLSLNFCKEWRVDLIESDERWCVA